MGGLVIDNFAGGTGRAADRGRNRPAQPRAYLGPWPIRDHLTMAEVMAREGLL